MIRFSLIIGFSGKNLPCLWGSLYCPNGQYSQLEWWSSLLYIYDAWRVSSLNLASESLNGVPIPAPAWTLDTPGSSRKFTRAPPAYRHDRIRRTACGKGGSQYARNEHRLNFDQIRTPIPARKNRPERITSGVTGSRYVSLRRFHSSLALRFSAGDKGVPKRWAETISEISPAPARTTPIN
jgi:hypothetical protein